MNIQTPAIVYLSQTEAGEPCLKSTGAPQIEWPLGLANRLRLARDLTASALAELEKAKSS